MQSMIDVLVEAEKKEQKKGFIISLVSARQSLKRQGCLHSEDKLMVTTLDGKFISMKCSICNKSAT